MWYRYYKGLRVKMSQKSISLGNDVVIVTTLECKLRCTRRMEENADRVNRILSDNTKYYSEELEFQCKGHLKYIPTTEKRYSSVGNITITAITQHYPERIDGVLNKIKDIVIRIKSIK